MNTNNNLQNNNETIKKDKLNNESSLALEKTSSSRISAFGLTSTLIITIFILAFSIFTIYNILNTNIVSGVSIKNLDVSNMSKSDAKYQLDNFLKNSLPEELKIKHLNTLLKVYDVDNTLKRGYSLVYKDNNLIKSRDLLKNDDEIDIRLYGGTVRAKINEDI